jgi:hypothetical protein
MSNLASIIGTLIGTFLFVISRVLFEKDKNLIGYFMSILGISTIFYIWGESFSIRDGNDFGFLLFSFIVMFYMMAVFYITDKLINKNKEK